MGNFIISIRKNGKFQFILKANNGKIILVSDEYSSKQNCHKGIDSVIENSRKVKRFERIKSDDETYYFYLRAKNGQIIGKSEVLPSNKHLEQAISSVMKNTLDPSIIEIF